MNLYENAAKGMKKTTRKDTAARKEALSADLRMAGRAGFSAPGQAMVSVRELALKYDLSLQTVSVELRKLAQEGVLHTVPRVGTFIGRPQGARDDVFLAIFPYLDRENIQFAAARSGFEERIARLGGTSLVMDPEMARRYRDDETRKQPVGVFEFHEEIRASVWSLSGVAHIEFGEVTADKPNSDMVYFDNLGGGRTATQHLISLQHHRIAYLGLHAERGDIGYYLWSKEREAGWRQMMSDAGLSTEGLAFHPSRTPDISPCDAAVVGRESARALLSSPEKVTAVVVVNSIATLALFEVLRETRRPLETWPAIVSFDSDLMRENDEALLLVTAFRLPWEEIGREAANVLWERAQGRLSGPPQQRLVAMSLIPRFSCRQDWHQAPMTGAHQTQEVAVL